MENRMDSGTPAAISAPANPQQIGTQIAAVRRNPTANRRYGLFAFPRWRRIFDPSRARDLWGVAPSGVSLNAPEHLVAPREADEDVACLGIPIRSR